MASGFALQRLLDRWEFPSEATLESFFWEYLPALLNLIPLKRQYAVNGEVCDIVAVNEAKQLVIIEGIAGLKYDFLWSAAQRAALHKKSYPD